MPVRSGIAVASVSCLLTTQLAAVEIQLRVLDETLDRPTAIVAASDGSRRVFVTEKPGRIRAFDGATWTSELFLDIAERVLDDTFERGLVGLTFDPGYATSGHFYVTYTDLRGDSVLSRFSARPDRATADPDSEIRVLVVEQPQPIHNVNQLAFGPDGYLYVTSGDGGPANDPFDTAQDLGSLLGKLLRIDPASGQPYAVPADNPFVAVPGARPEIWAYGLRNPARLSFDRRTGDLYLGDVGQASWEEIDRQSHDSPGGENYGWSLAEGAHCFDPPKGCGLDRLTPPILEYANTGADCAVIGGYVYRGAAEPELEGIYLFADFCSGRIWGARRGCDGTWHSRVLLDSGAPISTFGETEDGELLVAEWSQATGALYQVMAAPGEELLADGFESGSLSAWAQCIGQPAGASRRVGW